MEEIKVQNNVKLAIYSGNLRGRTIKNIIVMSVSLQLRRWTGEFWRTEYMTIRVIGLVNQFLFFKVGVEKI